LSTPRNAPLAEVGADDGRWRLAAPVFVAKAGDRDRQLGAPDARDLDLELRPCRGGDESGRAAQKTRLSMGM
jgi:hypothetical protein